MKTHPKYSADWWFHEAQIQVLPSGHWVYGPVYRARPRFTVTGLVRKLARAALWPLRAFRAWRMQRAVAALKRQMEAARPFLLENDLLPTTKQWNPPQRLDKMRQASKRLSGMYVDGLVRT